MAMNDAFIEANRYGKDNVRLLYVKRDADRHYVIEVDVGIRLTLRTVKDYLHGDNSDVIATDSQKNTVYAIAQQHGIDTIEEFALRLSQHFLEKYNHVIKTRIKIEQSPWKRIQRNWKEHSHAFVFNPDTYRTCQVDQIRNETSVCLKSGFRDFKVMKTTKSSFVNFVDDEYRTLPDMDDRIFCTSVTAEWSYQTTAVDFDQTWNCVKESFLETFAGDPSTGIDSPSVQKTLYDAGALILSRLPQIQEVNLKLPNVHSFPFDFTKFKRLGLENTNKVFVPFDKPRGVIEATITRQQSKL